MPRRTDLGGGAPGILNHLIACAWFAVSHMNAANWVSDLGIQDDSPSAPLVDLSVHFREK